MTPIEILSSALEELLAASNNNGEPVAPDEETWENAFAVWQKHGQGAALYYEKEKS
jgi:hypothetical protein